MGTRTQISKPPKLASVDVKERRARDYYFHSDESLRAPPLGIMPEFPATTCYLSMVKRPAPASFTHSPSTRQKQGLVS